MIRVCANCELDRGTLDRTDPNKTHGICKKHFVQILLNDGYSWPVIREGIDEVNAGGGFVETKKGQL